jgi:hypothetical protein
MNVDSLHLHALRLFDVCSADGSRLTDHCMEVQLDLHIPLPYSWPRTQRPEYKHRALWRSALNKVFLSSTNTQVLNQPLGNFSAQVSSSWVWKYPPSEQLLFLPGETGWEFYHVLSGRRQSLNRHYHRGGLTSVLPLDSLPASVSLHGLLVRLLSIGSAAHIPQTVPSLSFSQTLDALPDSSKWAIKEYALPSDLSSFIASLSAGSARAVSDGSFKDKFGSSAFTVVDSTDSSTILGLNIVPGHPEDQGAYHSELAGLYAIVLVVNCLCSWADIISGGIAVGCDGLSVLNKASETWPLESADPHFDMLCALCQVIEISPLSWTTRHVDGYQDNAATAKLDFWAVKNIQMDNLAKVFWMQHSHSAPVFYPISDEGFQVWLGDRKLSSSPASVFFDHIHGKTILA